MASCAPAPRSIPIAEGLPLLGSLFPLLGDPLAFFIESARQLGPIFRVSAPTRSYVVLTGIEATRFLLREDGGLLDHRPLYGNVARELDATHYPISTTGERHHHLRRTLKPAFALDPLAAAAPSIFTKIARVFGEFGAEPVGALDSMHRLLADCVLPSLSGIELGGRLADALRFARFSIGTGLGAYPGFFRFNPGYRLARKRMLDLFAERIDRPEPSTVPDFVDHVKGMRDEQGLALSSANIVALAQMIVSNTLLYVGPSAAFALHSLLSHPHVLARCRAEIDAACASHPSGAPTLPALRECTYFHAAMTESMRLHPIGLAAPRVATRGFEWSGFHIPAGESLLFAVSASHYSPEVYPEPNRFEPERHLAPRLESRAPGAFAPLGIGAHSCLAARLVDAMQSLLLASLVHHFDLELVDPILHKRVNPFPEPTPALALRARVRPTRAPQGADASDLHQGLAPTPLACRFASSQR